VIRVICPACQAMLDAKDRLLGQTRNCPRCKATLLIVPAPEGESATGEPVSPPQPEGQAPADESQLPPQHAGSPNRLARTNRYVICDSAKILAAWENNGQGWRLKSEYGFVSAARNRDKIPTQGDFKLIELEMAIVDNEHRLSGMRIYRLAQRWSLAAIGRDDDGICKSILGPGTLMRAQKDAVRRHLGEHIMRTIWGDATAVLDYLANDDYHSSGTGA
jgi:hypothetical protein